ncbi:PIN domain-containing protein [Syntrophomonas wolfei]|uniref:PIN domain-containing protein n=1 Tax=Syntrophomonas wolfei TaxID=863 RepID=UPI000773EFE3|nr:PIN domain-containing protein [Syntrophomonas wolfei]
MNGIKIIDANIILRYLTNDVEEMASACEKLLKRLESGEERVLMPDLVLADIVWTLQSFYHQSHLEIREMLLPLLALKGMRFYSKEIARQALNFYADKNIDWTDAFVAAQMLARGNRQIYSYDKDFGRIPDIVRLEP